MVIVVTLNSRYCIQTHSEWFSFLMQLSFLIKLIRHLEGLLFCLHCPAHSYKTRTRWSLSQWVLGSQSSCRNVCRCWLVGGGGGSLECSVAPGLGFYTYRQRDSRSGQMHSPPSTDRTPASSLGKISSDIIKWLFYIRGIIVFKRL